MKGDPGLLGAVIRLERLEKNFSQEGLCSGICTVGYLSKLEQGKAAASEDVLLPLLRRLGIDYTTDPALLQQLGSEVERLYTQLLSGQLSAHADPWPVDLTAQRTRYLASPYLLDYLLWEGWQTQALSPRLQALAAWLDARQQPLYLLQRLLFLQDAAAADALLRLSPPPFYLFEVGCWHYRQGRQPQAVALLRKGYDQAAQGGEAFLMLLCAAFLGNCYTETGPYALAEQHYGVALKLAAFLGVEDVWKPDLQYNLGATCLMEGRVRQALALLEGCDNQSALCWHKRAIACERSGRLPQARAALDAAQAAAGHDEMTGPVLDAMLALVDYRLRHPDYLKEPAYERLLTDTVALLRREAASGFVRFHVPYLVQLYESQRRYKDACALYAEFSSIPSI